MSTTTLTYSTAGSYNWYCPIGVTSITVNLWGGAGAGAYDSITTARIGGVGGIGGMEITYVSSTFNLIIWML